MSINTIMVMNDTKQIINISIQYFSVHILKLLIHIYIGIKMHGTIIVHHSFLIYINKNLIEGVI